jgi:uncharacterized protein (TIGR02246 family)
MSKHPVEETVEKMDEAFNRGDIETLLDFYEDDAVIVLEPGRLVRGKTALREAFQAILGFEGVATQIKTSVIEAGELALFTSRWNFIGKSPDETPVSRDSVATCVFRKQLDGQWRCVVDNSYGPAILE